MSVIRTALMGWIGLVSDCDGLVEADRDGSNSLTTTATSTETQPGDSGSAKEVPDAMPMCSNHATTHVQIVANLAMHDSAIMAAWDATNPTNTANFSTTFSAFDAAGKGIVVDIYFRMTERNHWNWYGIRCEPDQLIEIGSGALVFDQDGALLSAVIEPLRPWTSDEPLGSPITVDLGHPRSLGGTGIDGVTQLDFPNNVSSQVTDGSTTNDPRCRTSTP